MLVESRCNAYRAVNFAMTQSYWHIGCIIVEEEQNGKDRAEYGKFLIKEISKHLTANFGKGFTRSNLFYMKQFYLAFPKVHALRGELTWTHYRLLLKVEKDEARQFYEAETVNSNWSTRELERQIDSLLFERLAMSRDKAEVLKLSKEGQILREPKDIIKDPFVLEFLDLPDNKNFLERDLEQSLLDKLQNFLLELGKGFAFVARQKRITIDGEHFYVDLVFYNFILKCFVLIDLKLRKLRHEDIGKMDFYVRYFEKEEKSANDNPTIGLILCSEKNDAIVRYTLLDESKQIFASRYKLYLPTEEELRRELEQERAQLEIEEKLQID
ncbi:MAG TPA: PDDEXK nuclease domain-containing protein [Pyrinomonadaceae bacterium]|nr:PDDEXK nuclease domain-containing protein [Pyrinomonadaceae bacterium]